MHGAWSDTGGSGRTTEVRDQTSRDAETDSVPGEMHDPCPDAEPREQEHPCIQRGPGHCASRGPGRSDTSSPQTPAPSVPRLPKPPGPRLPGPRPGRTHRLLHGGRHLGLDHRARGRTTWARVTPRGPSRALLGQTPLKHSTISTLLPSRSPTYGFPGKGLRKRL